MIKKCRTLFVTLFLTLAISIPAFAFSVVNINTADLDELMSLQRVGKVTAKKIIAYREAHGHFKTKKEVMKVQGVGKKLFFINEDRIVVSAIENRSESSSVEEK